MGAKRNVDMTKTADKIKIVKAVELTLDDKTAPTGSVAEKEEKAGAAVQAKPTQIKAKKNRGKKYVAARSMIDKTKAFSQSEAIEMVKKASFTKFAGTLTADLVVREPGDLGKLTFPHATGQSIRVAIASDDLIKDLEAGKIDFDVLLSAPSFIPKLAKHAKLLGPKGLMPNPKNGTITQQPEKVKAELEKGSVTIKTERKAPLAHVVIGNLKMSTKELSANLEELIRVTQFKLLRCYLSSTMSPSVRVKID